MIVAHPIHGSLTACGDTYKSLVVAHGRVECAGMYQIEAYIIKYSHELSKYQKKKVKENVKL